VLEGLAAMGVAPEIVAGTSIGALVGAAFATGKLAALKTRMVNFGRRDVAAMLDVHLTTGGLIEGKRVETFLDSLGIVGSIETQDLRFAAVATDLASGREVWLQHGPIGHAVRASISMPGVFSPTRHDDRWWIDGGLVKSRTGIARTRFGCRHCHRCGPERRSGGATTPKAIASASPWSRQRSRRSSRSGTNSDAVTNDWTMRTN
jgi:NTE family protein